MKMTSFQRKCAFECIKIFLKDTKEHEYLQNVHTENFCLYTEVKTTKRKLLFVSSNMDNSEKLLNKRR